MSTTRILLGIFCLVAIGRGDEPSGSVLNRSAFDAKRYVARRVVAKSLNTQQLETLSVKRNTLVSIAHSQIGIREATGNNDGAQIAEYLKVTNLPEGNPWCASFVSWLFLKAGYAKPRTAWSPALFPIARSTLSPLPADVLGIYSIKLKRIAHCGIVERKQNNWIISVEGNTNVNGSREGDGVYRKWRHIKTIAKFANWVKK